MSTTTADSS
jgi:DNA-directed RNA polymerase specialized sigma24 family protein